MTHRVSLPLFAALLLGLTLVGCGSDESSSKAAPASTCEKSATRMCERAVECTGDGTARLLSVTDAGSASITSDSKDDCVALYAIFGCTNGGDKTIDYAACGADVETAKCGEASGKKGLLSPRSCSGK